MTPEEQSPEELDSMMNSFSGLSVSERHENNQKISSDELQAETAEVATESDHQITQEQLKAAIRVGESATQAVLIEAGDIPGVLPARNEDGKKERGNFLGISNAHLQTSRRSSIPFGRTR